MPIRPEPPLSPTAQRVMIDLGISPSRLWVLTFIAAHPDSTTRQVADEADMSYDRTGRIIADLVKRGLLIAGDALPLRGKNATYRLDEARIARDLDDLRGLLLPARTPQA